MGEQNHPNTPSRVVWVDFTRSVSIFLVIIIHTAGPLLYRVGDIPKSDWAWGNFYDAVSRMSVPLLFMVSGYLLLGHQESIFAFYCKRFWKVFIPFLFWSVLALLIEDTYNHYTFFNAIKAMVYAIITEPVSFHLWFLYDLMAIYLFIPLIRVFTRTAEDVHLWYFAALWFIFGPIQDILQHSLNIILAINLGFFTQYIGYFAMGYLLGRKEFSTIQVLAAAVIYIGTSYYTVAATHNLSYASGKFVQFYYNYLRLNIALMSVSAFILFRKLGGMITNDKAVQWFKWSAEASFGIYLIHATVLLYLRRAGVDAFAGPAIYVVPAVALLILVISWVSVVILQRIPVLKMIVPK